MGEGKPFVVYLLGALNIVVALVGFLLVLAAPGPGAVGEALCEQLDRLLARIEAPRLRELEQRERDLELETSPVRRKELQARIEHLRAIQFPRPDTSFLRLRDTALGGTYSLLRLAGFVVSAAVLVSGFGLLLSQGRWARYLAMAAGVALLVLVVAFTAANLFVATPALGEDVRSLLSAVTVPGFALDPGGLYPALAELCAFLLCLLVGFALVQYPLILIVLCLTSDVADAFFA